MEISINLFALILLIVFVVCIFDQKTICTTLELRSRDYTTFTIEYDDYNEKPKKIIKSVNGSEILQINQSEYTRDLNISWKSEYENPKVIIKTSVRTTFIDRVFFETTKVFEKSEGSFEVQVPLHHTRSICFIECLN